MTVIQIGIELISYRWVKTKCKYTGYTKYLSPTGLWTWFDGVYYYRDSSRVYSTNPLAFMFLLPIRHIMVLCAKKEGDHE